MWKAHHVFATPNDAILRELASRNEVQGQVFLLKDFAANGMPVLSEPSSGLLVIRGLVDGGSTEPVGFPAWEGPTNAQVIPPEIVAARSKQPVDEVPAGFLRSLKDLHDRTRTCISYYHCFMWGGEIETEIAWVFAEKDIVYWFNGLHRAVGFDGEQAQEHRNTDTLRLALSHHGLVLKTSFFEPHTRSFPWNGARLDLDEFKGS
jgi:hypothetical protein